MSEEFALRDAEHAFRLLEFSIRVLNYFELDKVDLKTFGQNTIIKLPTGNVSYDDKYFACLENAILTAKISVGVAFGASAIALDDLFEATGCDRIVNSLDEFQQVWALVYAIRNAFAHCIAAPTWNVKPYKGKPRPAIKIDLGGQIVCIDQAALNGKEFDYAQIGGLDNWLLLKDKAFTLIKGSGLPLTVEK